MSTSTYSRLYYLSIMSISKSYGDMKYQIKKWHFLLDICKASYHRLIYLENKLSCSSYSIDRTKPQSTLMFRKPFCDLCVTFLWPSMPNPMWVQGAITLLAQRHAIQTRQIMYNQWHGIMHSLFTPLCHLGQALAPAYHAPVLPIWSLLGQKSTKLCPLVNFAF